MNEFIDLNELGEQTYDQDGSFLKNPIVVYKIQTICKGAIGSAFKIKVNKQSSQFYVDKTIISKDNLNEAQDILRKLFNEYIIAIELNHPNIVKYKYF